MSNPEGKIYVVSDRDVSKVNFKTIADIIPGITTLGTGVLQANVNTISAINPTGNLGEVLTADGLGGQSWQASGGGAVPITVDRIAKGSGPSIQDSSISIITNPVIGIVGDVINLNSQVVDTSNYIGDCEVAAVKTLLISANIKADPVESRDILILNRGGVAQDITLLNTTPLGFNRIVADTSFIGSTSGNNMKVDVNGCIMSESTSLNNITISPTNINIETTGAIDMLLHSDSGKVVLNRDANNSYVQLSANGVLLSDGNAQLEVNTLNGIILTELPTQNKIECSSSSCRLIDGINNNYVSVDNIGIDLTHLASGNKIEVNNSGITINSSYILPSVGNNTAGQVMVIDGVNNCSFKYLQKAPIDFSVNNAKAVHYPNTNKVVLSTGRSVNPTGAFNGGGIGNKAIAGYFVNDMLLAALNTLEYQWTNANGLGGINYIPPTIATTVTPYINLIVDFTVYGFGKKVFIVCTDQLNPLINNSVGTYLNAGNTLTYSWNNSLGVIVVSTLPADPFFTGPAIVPIVSVGATALENSYSVASIIIAYPLATLMTSYSGDGGFGAGDVSSSILLVSGDSGNVLQSAKEITYMSINGAPF